MQATCDRVQIINQGKLALNDSIEAVSQLMQTSSLRLRTKLSADKNQLSAIEGVESVEELDAMALRINHQPEMNPAAMIANLVVAQGWELLELTPERRSLEEIFVDITTAESLHDVSATEVEAVGG